MNKKNIIRLLIGKFSILRLIRSILIIYILIGFWAFFFSDRLIFLPRPSSYQTNQDKLHGAISDMKDKLEETLVKNAHLIYTNKVLSDASLNERQKLKIVEAIAKAKTPEEAKNLQEALKTTVGTSKQDGPKSLRESVNRKSNLSGIMPRRKQPEQEFSFADQMKKLAGIK